MARERGCIALKKSRRGFTLVEILVVMALVGVIAVTAFAPIVFTVERLRNLQDGFGRDTALRMAARAVCRDLRIGAPLQGQAPARLVRHDVLGGEEDDLLVFWTGARERMASPLGSLVFRIVRESGEGLPFKGLYRWFLPGVVPKEVDPDALSSESAELIIPEVTGFRVSFYTSSGWVDEYLGKYPRGVRVRLKRKDGDYSHVDWLPMGWN